MSYRVGLLLKYLDEEYQASVFRGAVKEAEKAGIELICIQGDIFDISPSRAFETSFISPHSALNFDGIIFLSSILLDNSKEDIERDLKSIFKSIPIVSIGVKLDKIPSVICESKTSVTELLDHLINVHHYKRFLYLGGPKENHDNKLRENEIKKILTKKNRQSDEYSLIIKNGILFSESDGLKLAEDYCSKNPERNIDVIIAGSDDMAVGISKYINSIAPESYRNCPITGYDNIPLAKTDQMSLTTIDQPTTEMGAEAVKLMNSILNKKKTLSIKKIPSRLIIRKSCGCKKFSKDKSLDNNIHPLQREQFLRDVSYYGQEISCASDFKNIDQPLTEFLTNIACRDFALVIYDSPVKNIPKKARIHLHITDFITDRSIDSEKKESMKEIFTRLLSKPVNPKTPRCLYHLRVGQKRLGFIMYTADQNSPIYLSMAGMFLSHAIDRIFEFNREKNRARELKLEVENRTEQLKKESQRRQKVEEEILKISDLERLRFSLDLHDDICQRLAAMTMICKKDADTNSTLKILFDMATETLSRTRQYAHDSFPVEIDVADINDALNSLCREADMAENQKVTFNASGESVKLNSRQKINLFRIAQEALHNSVKHSGAQNISLSLDYTKNNVILTVKDNGKGYDKNNLKESFKDNRRPRGLGMRSMEYRANQIDGTFKITSKKNFGTTIVVTIPLNTTSATHSEKED
ncbi:MAG: substrate-binding domain-containing protein [Treponema sp.]|uniref:ATP-binding protein n=1 Tax=Treponema sp. TaxID=166 RepID=UPI00298DC16A|nr:ATP-binding protein [Treponema sp.]MBR5932681.1 substrate-binding domain-containing protein [Treponema sp.]